jgi:hypothetical protein
VPVGARMLVPPEQGAFMGFLVQVCHGIFVRLHAIMRMGQADHCSATGVTGALNICICQLQALDVRRAIEVGVFTGYSSTAVAMVCYLQSRTAKCCCCTCMWHTSLHVCASAPGSRLAFIWPELHPVVQDRRCQRTACWWPATEMPERWRLRDAAGSRLVCHTRCTECRACSIEDVHGL